MRTLPSGVRAVASPGEHVARPVYSLKGTDLRTASVSTCRTCGAPIATTTVDDGLRGSWRHTGAPSTTVPDTELMALVHEAHTRNLKYLADAEVMQRTAQEAYDAAWRRNNPGYTGTAKLSKPKLGHR